MAENALPRWLFYFAKNDDAPLPEDLSTLSDEELSALSERLSEQLASVDTSKIKTLPEAEAVEAIADDYEKVTAEVTRRSAEADEIAQRAAAAVARVTSAPEEPEEPEEPEAEGVAAATKGGEAAAVTPLEVPVVPVLDAEAVAALGEKIAAGVAGALTGGMKIPAEASIAKPKLNRPRLADVREAAPEVRGESGAPDVIIAAAGDVAGFSTGQVLDGVADIARAMHNRSRVLTDHSGYVPIAQIQREFEHTLGEDSTPEQVEAVIAATTDPASLVAAGGWCAPSEIMYQLFNIACEDGMIDLPTTGVARGGIRFPTSPSLADVFGGTVPWTWTEQNDIDAVTGTGTKPCVRVPCPTFSEKRLVCDGLCITAGNLTERAYPENLENYVKLVVAAHFHYMNARFITEVVAGATAVTMTSPATGATANLLSAIELSAIDYRERFRMCDDATLEVVLPRWIDGVIRSDLARRRGATPSDTLAVSDAEMMAWFDSRDVRVQYVADWQVNTTGFPGAGATFPGGTTALVTWPATVQFLIYAAGTYLKGAGPVIDLGVVRDSTLNAKNDFTAAWSEECNLIARVGHLGRVVTVAICPDGSTGPNASITCPTA